MARCPEPSLAILCDPLVSSRNPRNPQKSGKSGMFPTDDEVDDLLQHMDTDGEGGIELDEFLAHMADQIELRKKVKDDDTIIIIVMEMIMNLG